jgi:hypothetical protein
MGVLLFHTISVLVQLLMSTIHPESRHASATLIANAVATTNDVAAEISGIATLYE